jgi:hypothetical protein
MSNEATARPWEQHADLIWSPDGKAVIAALCEPHGSQFVSYRKLEMTSPDFREAYANAELIVRAVNAHDDLVAALREMLGEELSGESNPYVPDEQGVSLWRTFGELRRARAALAKGEEKQ